MSSLIDHLYGMHKIIAAIIYLDEKKSTLAMIDLLAIGLLRNLLSPEIDEVLAADRAARWEP